MDHANNRANSRAEMFGVLQPHHDAYMQHAGSNGLPRKLSDGNKAL